MHEGLINESEFFAALGLQFISFNEGVYCLQKQLSSNEHVTEIGLLLAEAPVHELTTFKIFLFEVPANVAPERIIHHWKTLDARRIEESGVAPFIIPPDISGIGTVVAPVQYPRPNGCGYRHAVQMSSGIVVCFN